MKRLFVLAAVLTALTSASAFAVGWTDNFDSYANQAAFNAVWAGTAPVLLDSDGVPVPVSSPNSVYQTTAALQSRRAIGADIDPAQLYFRTMFYDEMGTGALARTYAMVYSRGGAGGWTDTLQQIVAIGKYNGITTPKYAARVAFSSSNWFVLSGAADRSVGWHTAEIKGNGTNFDFYIDGVLGGSAAIGTPAAKMNWVVLGSGLTSTHGMNFDDVSVAAVPEPGSLLALGAGLAGFAGLLRKKS